MARGTGDKISGAWDKLKGRTKKAAGSFTNNGRRHAEGQRDYSKGGAKQAWGETKDTADKAKRKVKDAFD